MNVNLFSLTAKQVSDVATFMKENTSANKLKYATEAGVTHRIFFPTRLDAEGKRVPYVISAPIHAWGTGNSYGSCLCTKGIVVEGTDYDGTCPVCERLSDASDIVKYVKAETDANCALAGDARKKYLEEADKKAWGDRKVKAANPKYYVALALLKCDKDGRALVDSDGPKFSLHIAAWTDSTMQKFLDALKMNDDAEDISGREFKVMYGDYNDVMTRVGQAKVIVVDEKKVLVSEGSALKAEILSALESFNFEHSVELCRSEVKSQSPKELRVVMNTLFRDWDNYKAELAVNPTAKYLEYSATATVTTPEAPSVPAGALTSGAQAGTTGLDVDLDALDKVIGL